MTFFPELVSGKSRSQKKRESSADQRLGEKLVSLTPAQIRDFGLAPELIQAIAEWQTMSTHEARRRQMQFIGRLMREEDTESVAARLEEILLPSRRETEELHAVEHMRDALIVAARNDASGNNAGTASALEKELAQFSLPDAALPRIRHLAKNAAAEKTANKAPKAGRELFRLLKTRCDKESIT